PRIGVGIRLVRYPDRHRAESVGEPCVAADRPPVVEKDLHWSPHRHPTADQEAFANDLADSTLAEHSGEHVSDEQRDGEERHANHEAGAAATKQLTKPPSCRGGALSKKFADRIAEDNRFLEETGGPIEMNDQGQLRISRFFPRPSDDEFFGVGIEIPLAKW